jgi:hypothetical protein
MIKEKGLSLIEVMLNLFLGILLITALINHYLTAKSQYEHVNTLRVQAMELNTVENLLRESIRSAGFSPCLGFNRLNSMENLSKKLTGVEVNLGKHQALRVSRMSEIYEVVAEIAREEVLINGSRDYKKGDFIVIADCYHAEIRQIAFVSHRHARALIGLKKPLEFDYIAPVYLGEWVREEFYVKKNTDGENALFYDRGHPEELTHAVRKFSAQILINQEQSLVQVQLGLLHNQYMTLETKVRSA